MTNKEQILLNDKMLLQVADLEKEQGIAQRNSYPCIAGNNIAKLEFNIHPNKDEKNHNVFIHLSFGDKEMNIAGSIEDNCICFSHIEIDRKIANSSGFIKAILIRSKLIAIQHDKHYIYFMFSPLNYFDTLDFSFRQMQLFKRNGTRGSDRGCTFTGEMPKRAALQ
jgi:hypothetical protein